MPKFFRLHQFAIAAFAALAVVVFGSQDASAQSQTVSYSAAVTVQNTFTVGQTTALSLGTIAAVADPTAGTQASMVLSGNAGTALISNPALPRTSRILKITAGTPGVIAVSAAPPATLFTVSSSAVAIQLNDPASSTETRFDFLPAPVCAAFNCTTSATGTLSINVGGTLTTRQKTGTEAGGYTDGTYTGTYAVTLAF